MHFDAEVELDTSNSSDDQHSTWLTSVEDVRRRSEKDQEKANRQMIESHAKKNKVTCYQVGDKALVQNSKAKTRRGKRVLSEIPSFSGSIIEKKDLNYKIQYVTDDDAHCIDWFPVSQISSLCKKKENSKKRKLSKNASTSTQKTQQEKIRNNDKCGKEQSPMENLRTALLEWDLIPEETIGDGNCFFRAVSRMMFTSDEFHQMVRNQAIERVNDYVEDYQDYFLHEYNSPEEYIDHMSRNGSWADNAIIRATADALQIQIQIVSGEFRNVNTFTPYSPTQTIFLGYITDQHYVSTASSTQPQLLRYGGRTSDGIQLINTDSMDNSLSWILNLMQDHKEIREKFEMSEVMRPMMAVFEQFCNGNSAEAKKLWYEVVTKKKVDLKTEVISFENFTDRSCVASILNESIFGNFVLETNFERCTNKKCLWKLPKTHNTLDCSAIDRMRQQLKTKIEKCPSCTGSFTSTNILTVASPFLILYGNGSALRDYPKKWEFDIHIQGKLQKYTYDLSYVGMRRKLNSGLFHYTSFTNYKSKYWFHIENLNSEPPIKLLSLPEDVAVEITFLAYVCILLLPLVDVSMEKKKKKQKRVTKKKIIDVQSKLLSRQYVQLLKREEIGKYIEFDRNVKKVPGKGKNYLLDLRKNIESNGLKYPLVIAVSKLTGRAYIHDGNHRMAVLNNLKVEWVPVKISYFYINDDYETKFHFVPKLFEDWPDYPTPEIVGFTTLNLDPISYSSDDSNA